MAERRESLVNAEERYVFGPGEPSQSMDPQGSESTLYVPPPGLPHVSAHRDIDLYRDIDLFRGQEIRQLTNPTTAFNGPPIYGHRFLTAQQFPAHFPHISSSVGSVGVFASDSAERRHTSGSFVAPVITPQRSYPQHTVGISQQPTSLVTSGVRSTGARVTLPTFPLLGLSELQGHMPESGATEVIRSLGFSPVSGSLQSTGLQCSQLTERETQTESNNSLQEQEEKDKTTDSSYDPSDHDSKASSDSSEKDENGMSDKSDKSTDDDSEASSDSSWDIDCTCSSFRYIKKANVVCLDCCKRNAPKFCRKHSKDRHPGKLADIHHRIKLRSQATSQCVSYTQDDGDHNPSHKFSNRRYVCNMINYRENCEGEATVACLDCSSYKLQLKCSTCDISAHTDSKANHRRIRLHPVSTDDVREGSSTAAGSDGDGECGDSTSGMEEDGGESYGICRMWSCRDEAVEACLDCDVYRCTALCADCDIKIHAKKLIATHCRILVERFKPLEYGQKDVEILTETFDVPYNKVYVCENPTKELNLCEGKATYVILRDMGDKEIELLCNYCCKKKVKYLEDYGRPYRVIMLHYQDSVPTVEHENISMQQDNETNLENNTNETTPQIAMEHQIRTTDTQRNMDETTQSDMIDQNSDNSIVTADLGTTTGQNSDNSIVTADLGTTTGQDSDNSVVREDLDKATQVSSQHESSTVAQGNHEERARNSSDGDDSDHAEGSHYKCDSCDRAAHSVCMDCDRNLNRLCQQCYKTKHKTPARRRHLMLKIPHEPSPTRTKPVTLRNLDLVHDRYRKVLEYTRKQKSINLTEALKATGIKRQTLIDRHGIAELRIVDRQKYNALEKKARESFFLRSKFTVKDFELECRAELQKRSHEVLKIKTEGKLLPFDIQAYKTQ